MYLTDGFSEQLVNLSQIQPTYIAHKKVYNLHNRMKHQEHLDFDGYFDMFIGTTMNPNRTTWTLNIQRQKRSILIFSCDAKDPKHESYSEA